jgi:hypothetical protein
MSGASSALDKYWLIAVPTAIAAAGTCLSLSWHGFVSALKGGPVPSATVLAVLACTVWVFLRYVEATRDELEMAKEYVDAIPSLGVEPVLIIFAIAACFGALIAFASNLLVYSAILVCLHVADLAGTVWVKQAFYEVERKVSRVPVSVRRALREYYVGRPQLRLRSLRLAGTLLALGIAVDARIYNSARGAEAAWAAILLSVLLTELFHGSWRSARNEAIDRGHRRVGANPRGTA